MRPVVTSTAFLAVVLAVFAWPGRVSPLVPQPGLDPSWHAALAMATHQNLPWGTRIVFTFGPLGFLNGPALYYADTAILSFVFRFGLAAATFAVLLSATRRYVPLVVALPVAYVSGFALIGVLPSDEAALGIALALCVDRLSQPAGGSKPGRRSEWRWVALGGLAGLFALEKLSIGLGIVVLCAIAIACVPGRRLRALALTGVPAFVVFVIGWFATGNGLGNLAAYVRASVQTAAGYTAMAYDPAPDHHNALLLAALGTIAVGATAIAYARRLADAAPRRAGSAGWRVLLAAPAPVGLLAATTVTMWLLFKEAFVRQDMHRLTFLASVPLLLAALVFGADPNLPVASRQLWLTRRYGMNMVAALLLFSFIAFEVLGAVPVSLTDPAGAAGGFIDTVRTLTVPSRRDDLVAGARKQLELTYAVPPTMLAEMKGRTVAVEPYEVTVAWAYPTLRWDPLPVIQDYAAYTSRLDQIDVDFLDSVKAPQFILRQPPSSTTIDGRVGAFEPPATQVTMQCNYRQRAANNAWQLLERTSNRCSPPAPISTTRARFGELVRVPKSTPGTMVVATFDLHLSVWWHLLDRAYKPPIITVKLNKAVAGNRFVVGSAGNLHVLRPASTLGYSAQYAPAPIESMTFVCNGGAPCPSHVTVAFSSIPVR